MPTPRERVISGLHALAADPRAENNTGSLEDVIVRLYSISNQLLNSYHTTTVEMSYNLLKRRVAVMLYKFYADHGRPIPEGVNRANMSYSAWILVFNYHVRRAAEAFARGSTGDATHELDVIFGILVKIIVIQELS